MRIFAPRCPGCNIKMEKNIFGEWECFNEGCPVIEKSKEEYKELWIKAHKPKGE